MPSRAERSLAALLGLLVLAGCAGAPTPRTSGSGAHTGAVSDTPVRIGPPYDVNGRSYVPADDRAYDEVGLASVYGDRESGATASGERYRPEAVTAAHSTLPLPSYVEVTSLETGRTILVRINDRGPFGRGRIIDLSRGAAEQLGLGDAGLLRVRVRRVMPPESERAALRAGQSVAPRLSTSPQLLAALNDKLDGTLGRTLRPLPKLATTTTPAGSSPPVVEDAPPPPPTAPAATVSPKRPKPKPSVAVPLVPATTSGAYFIQLGAFSDRHRAEALARAGAASAVASGGVWRVRLGPYRDRAAATQVLAQARAHGYPGAALVRDPPSP